MQLPSSSNNFQTEHAELLRSSFNRLLQRTLLPETDDLSPDAFAQALFESPSVILSHGLQDDPIFNYGNRAALNLFEMDWDSLTQLPSRKSAEPLNRAERARLLDTVTRKKFIDDYSGVRISSSGRRFLIPKAIVWNLVDDKGKLHGQAATFSDWEYLQDR